MNRSAGVTASAVIGIIGSLISLLFGGLIVLSAVMTRVHPLPVAPGAPVSPIDPALMLAVMSVFYFGFGVWGIVSAIGLLRLRKWARICFVVFGAILAFFSVCGAFGMVIAMFITPRTLPPGNNVPAGVITSVLAIFAAFMLLCVGLGIWWVIYFNRRSVKDQFLDGAVALEGSQVPLAISIVAWFLIVSGSLCVFLIPFSFPTMMFGLVLRGWPEHLVFLVCAALGLGTGIGMLKKRSAALSVAVVYFVVTLLNGLSYFLIPGSFGRMMGIMQEVQGTPSVQFDMTNSFVWPAMLTGVLVGSLPLCLLLWRRKAFLEVCSK